MAGNKKMTKLGPSIPGQKNRRISDIITANEKILDPEQLLIQIVEKCGGMEGLASKIADELQHAPVGGMARQRILDMINRLMVIVWGAKPKDDPLDQASPEELEALIAQVAHKIPKVTP